MSNTKECLENRELSVKIEIEQLTIKRIEVGVDATTSPIHYADDTAVYLLS